MGTIDALLAQNVASSGSLNPTVLKFNLKRLRDETAYEFVFVSDKQFDYSRC